MTANVVITMPLEEYNRLLADVAEAEKVAERWCADAAHNAECYARAIKERNEVYENAIVLCEGEKVDYESSQHPEDLTYNSAIDHVIARMRIAKAAP